MILIVMGVTGCGKTTLGRALGEKLAFPFYDADDYHPESNRAKLKSDIALTDEDRLPWLKELAGKMVEWEKAGGAVLACSALKESYREILRSGVPKTIFVYLAGDKETIAARLAQRAVAGHELIRDYNAILAGQFRDLEVPANAFTLPVEISVDDAVALAVRNLYTHRERRTAAPDDRLMH